MAHGHSRNYTTLTDATEEDAILRAAYPSYDVLKAQLPHRTMSALKKRASALDIVTRRHVWTVVEVRRLRQAYEAAATDTELRALFPHLRLTQIKGKAGHIRIGRRDARFVTFGVPALDAIRLRAAKTGLSLIELDRQAGTGRFFQKSCRKPMLKPIVRAAAFLGGEVAIEWDDMD
jgi:hypothetical protein